jgi:hypothetical protein
MQRALIGFKSAAKAGACNFQIVFSLLSLLLPNSPTFFGRYGGDDEARTRDLCRDRAVGNA